MTRYRRDVFHLQKFGASGASSLPGLLARADWFLAGCNLEHQAACPHIGPCVDQYRTQDPFVVFAHASRWNELLARAERDMDRLQFIMIRLMTRQC